MRKVEVKDIKFGQNTGLINNYQLIVGPNGVGKTRLLRKAHKAFRGSVYISDGTKRNPFRTVGGEAVPSSFKKIKGILNEYEIMPEHVWVRTTGVSSFYGEFFETDYFLEVLKMQSDFSDASTLDFKSPSKQFIKTIPPILSWYLLEKYKRVKPNSRENIYTDLANIPSLKIGRPHNEGPWQNKDVEIAYYIKDNSLNFEMESAMRTFIQLLEGNYDKPYFRVRRKIDIDELLTTKDFDYLSDAGIISITGATPFSAGQKRLFEMLMKASSKGVVNKTIIIDEIDLNLHPKWLQDVVKIFDRIFVNSNFLISSHSPILISGFETQNILPLHNGSESWDISGETFGKNSSWILREVMHLEYTYATHAKDVAQKRAVRAMEAIKKDKYEKINKK